MSGEHFVVRADDPDRTPQPATFPLEVQPGDLVYTAEPFDYHDWLHRQSMQTLQQSRWCADHDTLVFFCEHKHQERP